MSRQPTCSQLELGLRGSLVTRWHLTVLLVRTCTIALADVGSHITHAVRHANVCLSWLGLGLFACEML